MKNLFYFTIIINLFACGQESNTATPKTNTLSELHREANEFYEKDSLEKAIKLYEKIIIKNPNDSISLYFLGQCYIKQHKYRRAITYYDQAIKIGKNYQRAFVNRGLAKYKLGDLNEAKSDCFKALALNPKDDRVHNNLGNIYMHEEDYSSAIINYKKACEEKNDALHYIYNLSTAYYQSQRYMDAEQLLVSNLNRNRMNMRFFLLYSKVLLKLEKLNEACENLTYIIKHGNSIGIDYSKVENLEIEVNLNNLNSFQEIISALKLSASSVEVLYFEASKIRETSCLTIPTVYTGKGAKLQNSSPE